MLALSTVLLDWPPTIAQLSSSKSLSSLPWLRQNYLQAARIQPEAPHRYTHMCNTRPEYCGLLPSHNGRYSEDVGRLVLFLLPKLWVSHRWCRRTVCWSGLWKRPSLHQEEWSTDFFWVISLSLKTQKQQSEEINVTSRELSSHIQPPNHI